MSKKEVEFISKMILDEVMELMATVAPPQEAKATFKRFIVESKNIEQTVYPDNEAGKISQIGITKKNIRKKKAMN